MMTQEDVREEELMNQFEAELKSLNSAPDEKTVIHMIVADACRQAAASDVMAWRDSINSDPESEGWAFMAAESMMTEWEYMTSEIAKAEDRLIAKLIKLDDEALRILSLLVEPELKIS